MILWCGLAFGGGPELGGLVVGGLGSTAEVPPVAGAEISPAWRFGQVALELSGHGGVRGDRTPWILAAPRARVFLSDPTQPVFSVFVGAGAEVVPTVRPAFQGGAAIDLGADRSVRGRIQATVMVRDDLASHIAFGAGAVFGRSKTPVTPEPVAVVPDLPPAAEQAIPMDEPGMVWVPGPVCQWLPSDVASTVIAQKHMTIQDPSTITSRSLFATHPAPPERVPVVGKLVVAASPRDHITVNGTRLAIVDGIGIVETVSARTEVEVVGGGRTLEIPVATVVDNAVWLPIEAPPTLRVAFDVDQTRLGTTSRAELGTVANLAGEWSFRVHGSFSPEGAREHNLTLAVGRAEAVRDALVELGLPANRIEVGDPRMPAEGLDAAGQRSAVLIPVEGL